MHCTPTAAQIALLQHTLGLSERNHAPYRNHFVAGHGHRDQPDLEQLEAAGLMSRVPTPRFCDPDDVVFCATEAGRAAAIAALPEPSKRTRYDAFLDYDGSLPFGEYLCGDRLPQFERRGAPYSASNRRGCEYRMYRWNNYRRDVEGDWAPTMKAAKASYKAALAKRNGGRRAPH